MFTTLDKNNMDSYVTFKMTFKRNNIVRYDVIVVLDRDNTISDKT